MTSPESCTPAGPADAVDGVRARWVARPDSVPEVAALLREAEARSWAVVPRGHGTKLSWGAAPARLDLLLDLSGLNRVVEHEAGDLVVVAEAGVALDDLQRRLAGSGQRLALDSMLPGATLGGIIATACSGPRRLGFGSVRDLLIGVTLVRADGVVAKAGGKVVKNVAGYDLPKLLTGSYGTLGVVVQAAFRLHPLPACSVWVETIVTEAHLAAVLGALVGSQLAPAAVEIDWTVDGEPILAVLLEGSEPGVAHRSAQLDASLPGSVGTVRVEPADRHRLGFPFGAGEWALKITGQLSATAALLKAAHRAGVSVRGSAGVGVFYGSLPASPGAAAAIAQLRTLAGRSGGSLVVLDGPAPSKSTLDVWGPVAGWDLMRRVKDQFDPGHRLAPGRFVGGL